jgi:hypothetical protein
MVQIDLSGTPGVGIVVEMDMSTGQIVVLGSRWKVSVDYAQAKKLSTEEAEEE